MPCLLTQQIPGHRAFGADTRPRASLGLLSPSLTPCLPQACPNSPPTLQLTVLLPSHLMQQDGTTASRRTPNRGSRSSGKSSTVGQLPHHASETHADYLLHLSESTLNDPQVRLVREWRHNVQKHFLGRVPLKDDVCDYCESSTHPAEVSYFRTLLNSTRYSLLLSNTRV